LWIDRYDNDGASVRSAVGAIRQADRTMRPTPPGTTTARSSTAEALIERLVRAAELEALEQDADALKLLANQSSGLLDDWIGEVVAKLRDQGSTWQEIANLTGVKDRQSAQEAHRRWLDRRRDR
jgi:hypothetical protein